MYDVCPFRIVHNKWVPVRETNGECVWMQLDGLTVRDGDRFFEVAGPLRRLSHAGLHFCVNDSFAFQFLSRDDADHACETDFSIYDETPKLEDFRPLRELGRGAFSTVLLVENEGYYAMKILSKKQIKKEGLESAVKTERNIGLMTYPLLVRLHFAFQTTEKLFLVTDFLQGGSLETRIVSTAAAKFACAQVALALSHLHSHSIVHRDVKAANVLLDQRGHAHLADYGLANNPGFAGTLEYMAPEVLKEKGSFASDWWALGCLLAELKQGFTPFRAQTPRLLMANILKGKPTVPSDMVEILAAILHRDTSKRLKDIVDLTQHPFFSSLDFAKLARKSIDPPITPNLIDTRPCDNLNDLISAHFLEDVEDDLLQQNDIFTNTPDDNARKSLAYVGRFNHR